MSTVPLRERPVPVPSTEVAEQARLHQAELTKPPGSLGGLETLAIILAGQQGTPFPSLERVWIAVFAGDHGVCEAGVSAFPQAVTGEMLRNFASGGAAISVLARHLDATLEVINTGTVEPLLGLTGVRDETVAAGTRNLAREPAMTQEQLAQALDVGDAAAGRAADAGTDLLIGGEMGIGNTTSAAAVGCALTGLPPERLVGRGTGVDDAGLARKHEAVARGLARHGNNADPLAVLASLGGLEIAALSGMMIGAAQRRLPVLVDGFIVSVAALAALRYAPDVAHWLHFSHKSREAGHDAILRALGVEPLLDLGMRLGEGSGAAVTVPLLQAACRLHREMATFESAGVSRDS